MKLMSLYFRVGEMTLMMLVIDFRFSSFATASM